MTEQGYFRAGGIFRSKSPCYRDSGSKSDQRSHSIHNPCFNIFKYFFYSFVYAGVGATLPNTHLTSAQLRKRICLSSEPAVISFYVVGSTVHGYSKLTVFDYTCDVKNPRRSGTETSLQQQFFDNFCQAYNC